MKKTIYLGPTIIGVATTSTVFDGTTLPATLTEAAQEEPALLACAFPFRAQPRLRRRSPTTKALPLFFIARLWLMRPSGKRSRATNPRKE